MKKLSHNIYRIELPVSFPVKTVNVYLIDENPTTLIDAGVKTDTSFQVLKNSLHERGYRIEDIKRILITHGRLDHYGQAKSICSLSGAEVYIHVEEYQRIQSVFPKSCFPV